MTKCKICGKNDRATIAIGTNGDKLCSIYCEECMTAPTLSRIRAAAGRLFGPRMLIALYIFGIGATGPLAYRNTFVNQPLVAEPANHEKAVEMVATEMGVVPSAAKVMEMEDAKGNTIYLHFAPDRVREAVSDDEARAYAWRVFKVSAESVLWPAYLTWCGWERMANLPFYSGK